MVSGLEDLWALKPVRGRAEFLSGLVRCHFVPIRSLLRANSRPSDGLTLVLVCGTLEATEASDWP